MNNYETKALKVRQQVSKVTKEQQKEILKIYDNAILGISQKAARAKDGGVTQKFLIENRKELKKVRQKIAAGINMATKNGVAIAAKTATDNEIFVMDDMLKKSGVKVTQSYKSMFFEVQESVVNDIISGNLYGDKTTLSDRIWNMTGAFEGDIQSIINEGILQKKSAIELAKDLQYYVKPAAMRPATWGKAYPHLKNKVVDYNAQRLARTSINHSYQTATIQGSNLNPFIEGIKWESAQIHGRTCDLCITRATENHVGLGVGVFPKDAVPLDHPNGLCTMISHIPDSLKGIADELNKWLNGESNPKLDKWFDEYGEYFNGGLKIPKVDTAKIGQLDTQIKQLQQEIDIINQNEYHNIWKNSVKPSDYTKVKDAIPNKKIYFNDKLSTTGEKKWSNLLALLDDFENKGKKYALTHDEILKLQNELNALLPKMVNNLYSPERKAAAYWFDNARDADALLRPQTGRIWNTFTQLERESAYQYTAGSGRFNRPLRGYDRTWSASDFKGVGNVSLNNEGAEKLIKSLSEALDRSSYDFDIWLSRGVGYDGFKEFVGLDVSKHTEDEVKQLLIGKVVKDEGFISTAGAEGKGYSGNKLRIYAPEGTKMLYCEPFSNYGDGAKSPNWDGVKQQNNFGYEFEVLLKNGYNYKITDVKKAKWGNEYEVELEVLLED